MNPANLFVFSLCLALLIVGTSSQKTNKWSLPPVGESVKVQVQVYFDSSVSTNDDSKEEQENKNDPTDTNFTTLFELVQKHFHNELVMTTFEVKSVEMNDKIGVTYGSRSLNASATLDNLKQYAAQTSPTNDTIAYFFTQKPLLQQTSQGDQVDVQYDDLSTFHTFCSRQTSAAVVTYYPEGDYRYYSTAEATARVFGLRKYRNFNWNDFKILLMVFSKCPKSDCSRKCLLGNDQTTP
uniref:28 kDa Metastriate family member n=1 Tax=Rhipicephalus appendiculatus TaxID=34631 RepID=A0A131Z6D2_RHIAP